MSRDLTLERDVGGSGFNLLSALIFQQEALKNVPIDVVMTKKLE